MNRTSHVLVIEDDLAVRLRIGDLLAPCPGLLLHEACDGPSGLAAARQVRPDLILLDIMMPGMTGYEVCAALRADQQTREIPIIVLSAAEESEAIISALEAGADDFLSKPFSAPELKTKIQTITRLNRYRALAGERDRLRWLMDHSLEPLIVADNRGALVHANSRARELFDLDGTSGADIATVIGRHFRAEPADAWAAWRELRLPAGEAFSIYQPDSAQVAARWFSVELHALDGEASQTLLKFTNRTGLVRRELETFTFQHIISHKIRTPLNGILPILTFLTASEQTSLDPDTKDLLRLARESAERLESTLLGILEYQAALFAPRRANSNGGSKFLSDLMASAAATAGLQGRVTLCAPWGAALHPEILEVSLAELLENYAKFSDADSVGVHATLERADTRWELTLFAPGQGLPPDVIAQLGRPYAQLERTFSGEVPGMGLGLAKVRLLLRSIGGDLSFSSHVGSPGLVSHIHLPPAAFQLAAQHAGKPTS